MRSTITVVLILISTSVCAKNYYGYPRKTEIPEPMFYDLVRSLHSQKGEIEGNALMYQGFNNRTSQFNISPEIEFVPYDHFGVEFELPTTGGNIHAYKAALQYGFERGIPSLVNGVQLMYERLIHDKEKEVTLKYLAGKRFKSLHSIFVMLGPRYEIEHKHWQEVINFSYFYDFSDDIDIGFEVNNISEKFEIQRLQVLPQFHLALGNHYKIQFGMGAQEVDNKWYTVSALRLIKEGSL